MRLAPISIALCAVLALVGCASNSPSPEPTSTSPSDLPDASSESTVASLDESSLVGLGAATPEVYRSASAASIFIPLSSIPESFRVGSVDPGEIVALARSPLAIDDRWLAPRSLVRVSLDDPNAVIRALVVPRDSIEGRDALRFDDRVVNIRDVATIDGVPEPLPASFARFESALADPALRWRARFALERFGLRNVGEPFTDPAVEAFAMALELRARAAIEVLRASDAALADRLHTTIGRTLTFPDGVIAPAWPDADAAFDDVLRVLLDGGVERAVAADRVTQWLRAQSRAVAWITDDIAPLGSRIIVAELHDDADLIAARIAPTESCDPATLHPLLPRTVAEIDLKCRERPARRTVHLTVGAWSQSLDAIAAPAEVSPPGFRIGPLLLPHSMRSFLASQTGVPDASRATAALIRRKPSSEEWQIYAECLSPLAERETTDGASDIIRFRFGHRDSDRATLEIRRDASSTLTLNGSTSRAVSVVVREDDDRWVIFADVPPEAFEPDGTLIVGVERTDARGVRSVWPRPVFPWERTPSRVAMDPSTWPMVRPPSR